MIYRGCELRCIAEVRAESDNHGGGWCIEARRPPREENERRNGRRPIKIDVSLSPARILLAPARNGTPFNNASDIE